MFEEAVQNAVTKVLESASIELDWSAVEALLSGIKIKPDVDLSKNGMKVTLRIYPVSSSEQP